ncbi:hypothetical protein N665_1457s0006 [Sinapis alba]|nr:hypothetical protein N665_1457s0006 [Sinapis alba]
MLSGLVGMKKPRDHGVPYSLTKEFVSVYMIPVQVQLLASLGHQSCGASTLWNCPNGMRNLVAQDIDGEDVPNLIDMAALENDEEAIKVVKEVYEGDIDKLDLNVGLHAEKKIKGFAIS